MQASPVSDHVLLENVPKWLLPRYHFFNIPASTNVSDPANPLNMLRVIASREDYVVLKLDIDNTAIEMIFIDQFLASIETLSLVDEFFFEHHVNFQPMNPYWGTGNESMQLSDSYSIFSKLRHHGIRAHGWV